MTLRTVRALTLGLGLLTIAPNAHAADWNQWRGAGRDAKADDFKAPATWPKQLKEQWKVTVGTGDATPALVGGRLYVFAREGAEEVTLCLDASSGKTIWQDRYAPRVTVNGPAGGHPGPRSSPAVAGGKVVTLGVNGFLSCLDAQTGKVAWRKAPEKDLPGGYPRFFVSSSPIIVDDAAIAQLGGGGSGAVMAFDLASGRLKWKADTDGPAYASPALLEAGGVKQIVAQTERGLVGLSAADGKPLWQFATPAQGMSQSACSPAIVGDTVIFSGQGRGTRAIRIAKSSDTFAANEIWANEQYGMTFSSPLVADGRVYGLASRGSLFCLDAKDGKLLWVHPNARGDRGFGNVVNAGGVLLAMTPAAQLIAFKPDDKQYTEAASIDLPDAEPYAYPVAAKDRIYIKGRETLTAYAVE